MAVQHIRQVGSLLVAFGAHLHDECAVGFAQVTVAAENAVAVEGETDAVGQFCGAELAAHVGAELLDVSGGAVGCYDGALAYRQGFCGGVVLGRLVFSGDCSVFLRGFSHGGLLLIYARKGSPHGTLHPATRYFTSNITGS